MRIRSFPQHVRAARRVADGIPGAPRPSRCAASRIGGPSRSDRSVLTVPALVTVCRSRSLPGRAGAARGRPVLAFPGRSRMIAQTVLREFLLRQVFCHISGFFCLGSRGLVVCHFCGVALGRRYGIGT